MLVCYSSPRWLRYNLHNWVWRCPGWIELLSQFLHTSVFASPETTYGQGFYWRATRFHCMFTKDNISTSGVKLQWRGLEEESQKWRLGSPGHKFPYFLVLSRKLGILCFYLPVLSSWTFKVMCAIILVFQPKIQESSWFCARVCSDLSLAFLLPLLLTGLIYYLFLYLSSLAPSTVLSK